MSSHTYSIFTLLFKVLSDNIKQGIDIIQGSEDVSVTNEEALELTTMYFQLTKDLGELGCLLDKKGLFIDSDKQDLNHYGFLAYNATSANIEDKINSYLEKGYHISFDGMRLTLNKE